MSQTPWADLYLAERKTLSMLTQRNVTVTKRH